MSVFVCCIYSILYLIILWTENRNCTRMPIPSSCAVHHTLILHSTSHDDVASSAAVSHLAPRDTAIQLHIFHEIFVKWDDVSIWYVCGQQFKVQTNIMNSFVIRGMRDCDTDTMQQRRGKDDGICVRYWGIWWDGIVRIESSTIHSNTHTHWHWNAYKFKNEN